MEIKLLTDAKLDLEYWVKTNDKQVLKKIAQLSENILISPYKGIGKPEPLKHSLSGLWSRRINQEHRLVYEIDEVNNRIVIHSLKGHYK